jgi:pimeloyl-ACP methyl ester carboxylesterase
VLHLIHTLCIAPVHLVGISLGGVITLQTVLDEPQAINRAVLINAFAHLRPKRVRTWFYLVFRFFTASLFGLPYQARGWP